MLPAGPHNYLESIFKYLLWLWRNARNFPFQCPNRSFGLEIGGHRDRVGNYRNALHYSNEPWWGRWSVQAFRLLFRPQTRASVYYWSIIYIHSVPGSGADTAADVLWYQSDRAQFVRVLRHNLSGLSGRMRRHPHTLRRRAHIGLCMSNTIPRRRQLRGTRAMLSCVFPLRSSVYFTLLLLMCHAQKYGWAQISCHRSSRLPPCELHTQTEGWLPVCLGDWLSQGDGGHGCGMTGAFLPTCEGMCICLPPGKTHTLLHAAQNTITHGYCDVSLPMSSSCPLLYILLLCRLTKVDSAPPHTPPLPLPWSNALTSKHLCSEHTTSPKVARDDVSRCVDKLWSLSLSNITVSSEDKRLVTRRKHTLSNNKWCYWRAWLRNNN